MTTVSISQDRAREILAAYGANPDRWPEAERSAVGEWLERSVDLQKMVAREAALDARLDAAPVTPVLGLDAVLAALDSAPAPAAQPRPRSHPPRQASSTTGPVERLLDWLVPQRVGDAWRPALVAAAPLVIGLYLGQALPAMDTDWAAPEQYVFAPLGEEVSDD